MSKVYKFIRIVLIPVILTLLIVIPNYDDLHSESFYYYTLMGLIPALLFREVWRKMFDEWFYERWKTERNKPMTYHYAKGAAIGLGLIFIVASWYQYVFNGLTPWDIIIRLSDVGWALMIPAILILGGLLGWIQKPSQERRFRKVEKRMAEDKEKD
ncbi:hypothetical protein CEY16_07090 [Halalkalibacillus sediminis]|uniref:Uncharacterized protein n=1 Tax=Halalkalibacillus sediminis TaxID=2018042 RepID=A0A2I0QTM7_9BACI|nr:hypothetical protein [Halalkalibacillus sediminis]PKR77691.1 hypothetical protein CEY16_07090 [Halalkalibacillus sediminis]